jgi:hypothetical protein
MSGDTEFGPPVARTRTTRKRRDRACYLNALVTADDRHWWYAEGMALLDGWWFHHAWNVDPDGRVLDRTWSQPGTRYVGRVFSVREVALRNPGRWVGPVRPELPELRREQDGAP